MKSTQLRLTVVLFYMALSIALESALVQSAAAAPTPRNIVFILIDDQRYDSLGMMGAPFLETPNLDSLAGNGLFFENAFVTTSLCSPSRASILSGQYAHKHLVLDNGTRMPASTPTFPQELQKGGYETGFIGKWHMGGSSDDPRPGFDRWVSFKGQGFYDDPTFNIDGKPKNHKGNTTDLITDYAIDFINQDRDDPFFLYVSHKAVHAMFKPAERHRGKYANQQIEYPDSKANTEENYAGKPDWVRAQRNSWHGVEGLYDGAVDFDKFIRDYAETMLGVDDSVGRIVGALNDKGLLDSTLIIYTSDNGFLFGEHGHIDKRSMYEESIRVPLIVHCPQLLQSGERRKEMILNIDYAPTILEAAGLPIPETIQGDSFYGLLDGTKAEWRDAFLYEYFWERSFPQTPTVLGIRTDTHKLMRFHGIWDRYELYDLENDPKEMNNLLADFKIKNTAGTLDRLIRKLAQGDLKKTFVALDDRLNRLLDDYGCAREPNWVPLNGPGR